MSFTENVLQRTQQLEELLAELGGTGAGLYERASSVQPPIERRLLSRLRLIAAVRNQFDEEDEYVFPHDEQQFLIGCDDALAKLTDILARRQHGLADSSEQMLTISHARFGKILLLIFISSVGVISLVLLCFKIAPPPAAPEKKPVPAPVVVATPTPLPSSTPAPEPVPQFATVAEAKAEAVRRFPQLGVAGSDFNLAYIERYQIYQLQKPGFFNDPSWPFLLAVEISKDSHVH